MKFNSWRRASPLFVDRVEGGQHRTFRALFKKNFSEQLHSQAAEEKEKAPGTQGRDRI